MRFYSRRNKASVVKVLYLVTALLGFAVVLYASRPVSIYSNRGREGKLAVRFLGLNDLGVNNGEASLITFPDGSTMLVDTSMKDKSDQLLAILEQSRITKIDYLFITHFHNDHTGGVEKILETMEIGQAYLPEFTDYRGPEEDALLAALQTRSIPYTFVTAGMLLEPADGVRMEILNPAAPTAYPEGMTEKKEKSAFENNNSVVFMLTHDAIKMLFTGDIYTDTEHRLIKQYGQALQCDLLKVPHHGIGTSSSALFLMEAAPDWSVIQSGQPSTGTYGSVASRSKVYVTGAYGTVLAVSDGQKLEVSTEHPDASNGVYS